MLGTSTVSSLTSELGRRDAQTGALTDTGTTTIGAGANAMTLANAGNALTGSVTVDRPAPTQLTNMLAHHAWGQHASAA